MRLALHKMLVYGHEQNKIPALLQLLDCGGYMVGEVLCRKNNAVLSNFFATEIQEEMHFIA